MCNCFRVLSLGQEVSKRTERLGNSTVIDQLGVPSLRRSKSVNADYMDPRDIGDHHILELPSLLEPKG